MPGPAVALAGGPGGGLGVSEPLPLVVGEVPARRCALRVPGPVPEVAGLLRGGREVPVEEVAPGAELRDGREVLVGARPIPPRAARPAATAPSTR